MTDEPTEIDANQSADPIGTAATSEELPALVDAIPSNLVEREYDASAIQVLEGLDAVRKRPGMYIGSTGERGLHHLVTEVVDNAVDEAMAGYGDRIVVTLLPDGAVSVEDNGRGIPVDIVESEGKPAVTVVLTVLHAGGKFGGGGYKVSGGLHGVGVSVVNALSTRLKVDVRLKGKLYTQSFTHGVPDEDLAEIGTSESNGTTVTFWADPDVFETTTYSYETLATRFREMAFLNKGLEIVIRDERPDHTEDGHPVEQSFKAENGLVDYVKYLTGIRETVHRDVISFEAAANGENSMSLEVALQWSGSFQESVHTFANAINTHEGGTHEEGFRAALTSLVNSFGEDQGMIKKKEDRLTGDDIREGLTAIISVKLAEPQFEGQTKTKLGNTEVKGFVQRVVNDRLGAWFEQNPAEGREIIRKATAAASARIAARKARDLARNRKGLLGGGGLPGKLADCQSTNPEECEVYIVEGDSAGGSAKGGRDPKFQAILPIRGKILNVEKARIDKVLQNNEVQAIISALGTGIHEDFDEEKLRYHKIVIMADADVDGQHIRTLLLTLLFRFMRPLIERGHVYAAQPPLYKIRWSNGPDELAYTDRERDGLLEAGYEAGKKLPKENPIQRYKGLGEMNANELWDTTMDPANRVLLQITLDDAIRADETFQTLMGDDIEARRSFIQRNAKDVRFLDI
ncbi:MULTISPECIES: DNA topoisomerase (ATP-hydrolyzing) subunit B [Kribbella]|uniref:DNA gyrase subunit B n=1 Tax=Kribbella pratensis TaxID=2512112 RepID=A0ABY2FE79_9ACTN|nr:MULTISPECIES: DNA topoisomerase (ATP-hydrolyzing) subunit B [Kribbella]TDO67342.1 DNA gyrase subunit B [Kribbella sp. VKM Ac-2571]TDW89676.1 DNA gyrase subunit B [Kribbella pratensis]TDX08738.1 DNA gyrase subunit B [Kribbella sp. VKM Ac-2566]